MTNEFFQGFSVCPVNTVSLDYETAILSCSYSGANQKLSWRKDGEILTSGPEIYDPTNYNLITTSGNQYDLEIKAGHAGQYSCSVSPADQHAYAELINIGK